MHSKLVFRGLALLLVSTLTFAIAATTTAAPQPQDDKIADFVAFDRLYIPALALTKQEKAQPSRAAMKRLSEAWAQLKARHAQADNSDPRWTADFHTVGQLIDTSSHQVADGEFAQAHETLEGVRNIFRDLRKRHMIDYELDLLTNYHDAMEEIVKAATAKTAATLTEPDIENLKSLTRKATELWEPVKSATFASERYHLDTEKKKRIQTLIMQEAETLDSLHHALEGGDKTRVLAAANQVRPVFAQLYMTFGDFPSP